MAELLGVSGRTLQDLEAGDRLPKADALQRLVELGCNMNWLVTGAGNMVSLPLGGGAEPPTPPAAPAVDGQLLGRVVDAIKALYKAEGVGIADIQVGQVAAAWYNQIVAEAPDDPIGQGLALAGRIEEHRAQLRRDAGDPAHAKRQA